MFGKIFGNKEKMYAINVYWKNDVDSKDLVDDLAVIKAIMDDRSRPTPGKGKIKKVQRERINTAEYITAEINCNKFTKDIIEKGIRLKAFKAAHFMSETVTV